MSLWSSCYTGECISSALYWTYMFYICVYFILYVAVFTFIFIIRENLLARQTLEQNLVQTGATDLDVAMFHRDGGKRTFMGLFFFRCFLAVNFIKYKAHSAPLKDSLMLLFIISLAYILIPPFASSGGDSDSDSDLSMDEEHSLSIPSSESDDNVRLRGRIQRRFKRSNHSERLLTEPTNNGTKGTRVTSLSYSTYTEG